MFSATNSSFLKESLVLIAGGLETISCDEPRGTLTCIKLRLSWICISFFLVFPEDEDFACLCEEELASSFSLREVDLSFMSLGKTPPLATESKSKAAVFFCFFCLQTRARSATRLLFLLQIPTFPTSLLFEGDEWWVKVVSCLGPTSESLLSERFFAFEEALSLWWDFTLLAGPENFFLDDVWAPAPSDEETNFSLISPFKGEHAVAFLSDLRTWQWIWSYLIHCFPILQEDNPSHINHINETPSTYRSITMWSTWYISLV